MSCLRLKLRTKNAEHYKRSYLELQRVQSRFGFYTLGGCAMFSHYNLNGHTTSIPHVRLSPVNTDLKHYDKTQLKFLIRPFVWDIQ